MITTTLFKGRQKARYEAGRILAEDQAKREAIFNEQVKEEKELSKKNISHFSKQTSIARLKSLNEDKQVYKNAVDSIVGNIIRHALPGDLLEEVKVLNALKSFKQTFKHLLNENASLYTMPLMTHRHHVHHHVGANNATVENLIKKLAMSYTIALKNSNAPRANPDFGIMSSINSLDATTQLGTHVPKLNGEGVTLHEDVNAVAVDNIKFLCEQISPVIKERALRAFNEEQKLQKEIKELKEESTNMLTENFSPMEVSRYKDSVNKKAFKRGNSLFNECFKVTKLLNEEFNPSNEEVLQETIFNMIVLEMLNECNVLKEGIDLRLELGKMRRQLLK